MLKSVILVGMLLSGCGFGDETLDEVDPEAVPGTPTWIRHIEPIMYTRCTACHASDAQPGQVEG